VADDERRAMNGMSGIKRAEKARSILGGARGSTTPPHLSPPHLELVTPATRDGNVARPFVGDRFMVSSPTRAETASAVRARVGHLIDYVRSGRIFDAIEEFYAPDVELGREAMAPMFGFGSGAGRRWVGANQDAEWRSFRVRGFGVNGDTSFIECSLDFVSRTTVSRTEIFRGAVSRSAIPENSISRISGKRNRFTMNQVAVAQWCDGKIVKECLIPRR
jgi:hypothetical protein